MSSPDDMADDFDELTVGSGGSSGENGGDGMSGGKLVLSHGRIRLPGSQQIVPTDAQFHAIIQRVLPQEAPELIVALKARREESSRLSRIGLFLGIALVAVMVFFLWPRGAALEDARLTYVIDSQTDSGVSKQYAKVLAEAEGLLQNDKFMECETLLAPVVTEILESPTQFSDNARLLSDYLMCLQKNEFQDSAKEKWQHAVALCQKAGKFDSSPEWQQYELYFSWVPYRNDYYDYERLLRQFRRVSGLKKPKDTELQAEMERLHKFARAIRERLANRRSSFPHVTLDKITCQILIARWIVEGYSTYPDDFGNAGVEWREAAYQLAGQYENSRDFLEIRRMIAQLVLAKDKTWFNYFYFDGEERYRTLYLSNLIKEIDAQIKNSGNTSGRTVK